MKQRTSLTTRGLLLFLSLATCLGTMQITAFADDVEPGPEPDPVRTDWSDTIEVPLPGEDGQTATVEISGSKTEEPGNITYEGQGETEDGATVEVSKEETETPAPETPPEEFAPGSDNLQDTDPETPGEQTDVSVPTTPGSEGESSFEVDPSTLLTKPEFPEDFVSHEDLELENGSGTVDRTWELSETLTDADGKVTGYVTRTTETTETIVTVDNVPENRPDNAEDIEGGYRYVTEETLSDGTRRIRTTTVINGQTTTKTLEVTTVETRQEVLVDPETGKVTVKMYEVKPGAEQQVTGEYVTVIPTVKPNYNNVGYDGKNDLYDRDGFNDTPVAVVSGDNVNVRNKPGGASLGKLSIDGTSVYVYEEKDGWSRIGENAWISSQFLYRLGNYQVKTSSGSGVNIRTGAGTNHSVVEAVPDGTALQVYEVKKDSNGKLWCRVGENQWVSSDYLKKAAEPQPEAPDYSKYDYFYLGEHGLESSIRVDLEGNGSNTWMAHQYILRDKNNGKFYVYCADISIPAQEGYGYKLVELNSEEGQKFLTSEKRQHLNNIALNGYWGTTGDKNATGSLNALKDRLKTYLKSQPEGQRMTNAEINALLKGITPGVAVTATQASLWYYGNSGTDKEVNLTNFDSWIQYYGAYYDKRDNKVEEVYDTLDSDQKKALKALCEWLIQIDEKTPGAATTPEAIDETTFATDATVTVKEQLKVEKSDDPRDLYRADVAFAMKVKPSQVNDDLIVSILVDGKCVATRRIAGAAKDTDGEQYDAFSEKDGVYTFEGITLPNGAKIDIQLKGTQDLGNGVYIFSSEQKDGVASQTFIGLSEAHREQGVDLSVQLDFNVNNAKATVVTKRETTTVKVTEVENTGSQSSTFRDIPRPKRDKPTTSTSNSLIEIEDEEVPLIDIPEEDVPLTGDISLLWYAAVLFSAAGLAGLALLERKQRSDNAD